MSSKRYIRACEYCGQAYVARSLKSRFDSDQCRGAYNRQVRKGEKLDSEFSNTYTDQDIWILVGKICEALPGQVPKQDQDFIKKPELRMVIQDFESRFRCHIDEVFENHPTIRPGKTADQCLAIAEHYRGMAYSK